MSATNKDSTYTMTVRMPIEQKPTIRDAVFSLPAVDGQRPSMNEWAAATLLSEAQSTLDPRPVAQRKLKSLLLRGYQLKSAVEALEICCPRLMAVMRRQGHNVVELATDDEEVRGE